jgi:phage anti-repressor protein
MKLFETEKGFLTSAKDIYDRLGIKRKYAQWIKYNIERAKLELNKDFVTTLLQSTGGRQLEDYLLTRDSAITIIVISGGEKAKELRDEVIKSYIDIQTGGAEFSKKVIEIIRMVKIFSIYEYRSLALKQNKDNYIKNALMLNPNLSNNVDLICSKFNQWRNEVLKTGKNELAKRIKEYCLIERRRIPAKFTQDEAFVLMGDYEMIKNAVWDLLSSKNFDQEYIENISKLSQQIAIEIKPFLQRLNESNLFFQKIPIEEIKQLMQ